MVISSAATVAIREAPSIAELLAGATERRPMKTGDSLSGSRFERVLIDGAPYVVKYLCVDDDWIMRGTGDVRCRQLGFWRSAAAGGLPPEIDHAVAGIAEDVSASGRVTAALLLRDVGEHLVVEGSAPLAPEQELRFLDHMAALHAAFWGWPEPLELMPVSHHYTFLTPTMAGIEADRGSSDAVPRLVAEAWPRLARAAPRCARLLTDLAYDPWPLVEALERTPATMIHGDWKLGNLGSHPDGRTVLIDWDRCGRGMACMDLAWYLAVNCDRLAHAKETVVARYRAALEGRGVDTAAWFERQLGLSLIGAFVQLGWAKATGDATELGWWQERVVEAEHHLS